MRCPWLRSHLRARDLYVPSNRMAQIGWTFVLISLILLTRAPADLLSGLLNRSVCESLFGWGGEVIALQGRDNRRRKASMMRALAAGNGKASSSATSTQRTCWQARARGSPARCSHRCTTNRSRLWL